MENVIDATDRVTSGPASRTSRPGGARRFSARQSVVRPLAAACAVLCILLSSSVASAPPANAASYGYVYISLPTWLGNCNWGSYGKVTIISGTVDNVSSVSADRGDDIVYMKVRLGDTNRVQFAAFCSKGWGGYWQPGFTQTIRPTRWNQTWWVGPAGVRSN